MIQVGEIIKMGKPAQAEVIGINEYVVVIRDVGNHDDTLTITNDAENVMERLLAIIREHDRMLVQRMPQYAHIPDPPPPFLGRVVVYIDSEGELEELAYDERGKFVGFRSIVDSLSCIVIDMAIRAVQRTTRANEQPSIIVPQSNYHNEQ
jgi:hypothetical protein